MVEKRGGSREFYSGRELEVDVFGKPKFPTEYEQAYRRLAKERGGYLPYEKAQSLIREFTPDDPTNPSKEFARDLRLAICEILELEGEEADIVKIYSALGTALDIYHGVDAWIEIDLDGLHAEASMDVTHRSDKLDDGHKADVILGDILEPENAKYLAEVDKYAETVADVLLDGLRNASKKGVRAVRR
ncbi:MAG: hypothetical protein WAZ14_01750 [Patescibacteria group bacterium]